MPIYIVGAEGCLQTHDIAPRIWRGTDAKGREWVRYGWPHSSSAHMSEKGRLSEGKSATGLRIFARVLPPDTEADFQALSARIEEAKALYQRLMQERQELLGAAAVRGARVRVKDAVPLNPLLPSEAERARDR